MSIQDADDRAEYYRITDRIALQINTCAASGQCPSSHTPAANLLAQLQQLQLEAQQALRQLSERDRALDSYLKLNNKRLEVLTQIICQDLLGPAGTEQEVQLSEQTLTFNSQVDWPTDQALQLNMQSGDLSLLLEAAVVESQAIDQGYQVTCRFIGLNEAQRQLLARHILHRQAEQRRLAANNDAEAATRLPD